MHWTCGAWAGRCGRNHCHARPSLLRRAEQARWVGSRLSRLSVSRRLSSPPASNTIRRHSLAAQVAPSHVVLRGRRLWSGRCATSLAHPARFTLLSAPAPHAFSCLSPSPLFPYYLVCLLFSVALCHTPWCRCLATRLTRTCPSFFFFAPVHRTVLDPTHDTPVIRNSLFSRTPPALCFIHTHKHFLTFTGLVKQPIRSPRIAAFKYRDAVSHSLPLDLLHRPQKQPSVRSTQLLRFPTSTRTRTSLRTSSK